MAKFLENTASIKKSVQKKKKDNQETVQKKQSPSVSKKTKQVNDRMTQKYGGGTTKKSVSKPVSKEKNQAVQTRLQSKYGGEQKTVKRQTTSSAQRRTNANNNLNLKQNQIAKSQAEAKERREFKPTASQRITIEDRLNNKYGLNKQDEKRVESANRVIRNTGSAAKKGVQDALSGYGQTIADLTERTASNKNGTQALAMKRGIDTNDKTAMRKLQEERDRTVEHAREERTRLFDEQEKRQQKFDNQTKGAKGLEKALYGAVESGTGMAVDMVAGLGTQAGALASMGVRTYGQTRGQAEKEGATEREDRLYALTQAGKEVGTELMFPGVGAARRVYGGAARASLGELATNTLLRNLKGKTADVASAGIKLLGGTAEENLEEIAGWGIDPILKEYTYGRNVRKRDAENVMRERSDALRSQIANEDDAKAAAAYISSPSFIEDTKREYINSGMNEKDAEEIASRMRDYLSASLTGDTKAMTDIEDEVGRKVAGLKKLSIADWDFKELAETVASTTLLTATTGMPGTVATATKGAAIRDALGTEGTKALAKTAIDFEDEKLSRQGRAIQERLDSGKDITSTQAYELMSGMHEQVRKDTQRVEASRSTAARQMESERLVVPFAEDPRTGEIIRGEVTEQTFRREETSAKKAIEDQKASLTEKEVDTGSRAIANFKTGTFGVDDANALNYSNEAVREAFKAETGINLDTYIVRNKDGSVNIPATNTATKDALFALAADNLVQSAQAETINWMDNVKGEVVTQITARMGAKGSVALQQALDDVDERDRSRYMMTANATDMLYQAARNMGESWEEVKADAVKMFPNISEDKLQMMYEAGLEDRNIANDKARGRQVQMGASMSQIGEQETATGMVYVDTPNAPKGTMVRTFTEIAQNLGADIHLTDAIRDKDGTVIDRANGSYDPKTNSFYLNVDTGIEKNVGYIFMHELTHYLRRYAPEQYQELENLVREKWFGYDASQMQDAIARKIEAYKVATNGKQILTEDMALEEIICDAAHEFINDPNFANSVAEEDPTLAQAVLNSIRNALRMLRRIFASGTIEDETHMNSLFSELGILSEAEEIWLNAYKQAVKNRAMENLDAWEDEAFKDTRLSVGYHAGDLGKSTVDDYAHQGYSRGSGHFGFGTYFVGDEEQINSGNYGKRKHETVDFDKYNLFRPDDFEQGIKLHDALKKIDGFIEEYSSYAKYKDSILNESLWNEEYYKSKSVNRDIERLVEDYEMEEEPNAERKDRIDKFISEMPEYYRNKIESEAEKNYNNAQSREVNEDEIRERLAQHYELFGSHLYDNADDYVENNLEFEINHINWEKEVPYDQWKYEAAKDVIKDYSESWTSTKNAIINLSKELLPALGYKHTEGRIEDALLKTEEIVNGYQPEGGYRLNAEPGLDSGATVFMKQLGYEGVDVRHIPEMDNTGYGSVIYDLKGEDLARKQEIGTARFSITPEAVESLSDPTKANSYAEDQMLDDSDNTVQDLSSSDLSIRFSFGPGGTFYEKGFHAKSGANVTGSDIKKSKGNPLLQSGKDILTKTMKKNIRAELKRQGIKGKAANEIINQKVENVMNFMDAMNSFMENTGLQYTFIGMQDVHNAKISVRKTSEGVQAITMSAMVKNGEYPINFDFTTICKKRQAFNAIIEKLTAESAEGVDISLSPQELGEINNALRKEGLETACLGCFVEARRYNMQNYTNKVCDLWNKCVDEYAASIGIDPADVEDFNFSNGEETTEQKFQDAADTFFEYENTQASKKNPEDRFKHIIRSSKQTYMKHLHPADLITSSGIQHIKDMSTKSKDFFGMLKSAYGVSAPKETIKYVPYNSEVALLPENRGTGKDGNKRTMLDYLKSIGGIRMQSFSDYLVANTFDYMQMVADMAARGFPAHAYTKEIAFARVFGMTGIKINLSIMFDVQNLNYWRGIFKNASEDRLKEIASKYAGLQYFENADDIPEEFKDYDKDGKLILDHGSVMEINEDGVKGYLTYLVGDENRSQRYWEETYRRVLDETKDEAQAEEQANEYRKWIQSINFKDAKDLQRKNGYGANCGMIGVGLSDANILLMLNDDNIPYIIPYHASGLPDVIKQHTGLNFATNYEDTQNTRIFVNFTKDGEELGYDYVRDLKDELGSWQKAWEKVSEEIRNGDIVANGRTPKAATETEPAEVNKDGNPYVLHGTADFDFYEKLDDGASPQEAAEMYLEYCDEYGLLPVFPQFAGHPNYYKLLVDYSVTDLSNNKATSPQGTVRNIYPGSNGTISNIDEGSTDYEGIKDILVDEFEKLNKKNEHRDEVVDKIVDEWKRKDIRHSITPEMDSAYMSAVNSGNMEEAQRLVDEAAKSAGWDTPKLHHGSPSFGFTTFDLSKGEGIIFATNNRRTAETYSGETDRDIISDTSKINVDDLYGEKLLDAAKKYTGRYSDYRLMTGSEKEDILEEDREEAFATAKDVENFISENKDSFDGEKLDLANRIVDAINRIGMAWNDDDAQSAFEDYWNADYDLMWMDESIQKEIIQVIGPSHVEILKKRIGDMLYAGDLYARGDSTYQYVFDNQLALELDAALHRGIYGLYGRSDNQLVIDANGANWNQIVPPAELELDGPQRTRSIAEAAKKKGYDSVLFKDLRDNGGATPYNGESDVYMFFTPSQVKSADTVTYAEDGSVIPLSQRFDPNNDDIRYSMPTQDADGNILSDGQMDYFKNSQARDENGRLVPVYHTTNHGGFTIFDPSYSDDNRSLFFASNWNVSQTYGRNANNPIEYLTDDEQMLADEFPFIAGNELEAKRTGQKGYYSCYLNLENPLIVDAHGDNWNDIRYGDDAALDSQTIYKFNEFYVSFGNHTEDGEPTKLYFQIEGEKKNGDHYEPYEVLKQFDIPSDISEFDLKYNTNRGTLLDQLYEYWSNELGFNDNSLRDLFDEEMTFSGELQYKNADRPLRFDLIGERLYETTESYNTRQLASLAESNGHDGVIIRNLYDIGGASGLKGGNALSDIFIAFSSNQVKDIRNENPTENPDIRYSVTPEDEAKSKMAYADAMDTSYEALERYEKMAAKNPNVEQYFGKAFKEEDVSEFYSALRNENGIVFDDPVLEEGRQRLAKTKNELYSNIYAKANDRWTTGGEVLDIDSVKTNVRNLVMGTMANSNTDHKYKQELVDKTLIDMRTAFQLMKQDRTDIASALLYHSAQRMIENVDFIKDDTLFQEYKGIRDYLRREPIYMDEEYWQSKTFLEFQRANMGKLKLRKGDGNVDVVYGQLEELWPHIFNETERSKHGWEDSPEDLLEHIEYVINQNQKPFMEAYTSEEATSLCYEIADNLYDIMARGEELSTLADTYKKRFDERTKALKARHQEAIAKVRENAEKKLDREKSKNEDLKRQLKTQKLKTDAETRYLKYRSKVDIGMLKAENAKERRAERERRKKEKAQRKENALHKKYMESIQKSHKALTDRLRTNTKDKHIPEFYKKQLAALLGAFDFQTLKSKAMEMKEGPDGYVRVDPSAKTIKMLELQAILKAIENQSQLFHVSDSITDIMDNLLGIAPGSYGTRQSIDGKTLDELDASELKDIDRMLKSLIHEFNNYENVRVGMQKQKASTIGGAQIESCLKHAEKFGTGNDYFNAIGAVDQIINLDEMTPAYLFRRIDPNGDGLGIMWKELRRSFDRYVRNQNQLNDWMEEIVGKYHKKGMLWNKYGAGELSDWRSENYAMEFTLSNGQTIKLTIAQMMSIHCLAKREQAYRHMTGAGIVVKPVSFQAKMMSDLKKKANYALPVSLSHEDLLMIDQNLSKEQIDVADKLQQLMATKMAEWGNEASMNVIGIRLFEDPDYFPIKSDRAALEKDFSAEQFTEMIRSFGFTKAVQPGAKNAIAIDDIFDVVTEHCNNMNLYNSYTESLNDFMKVYNYHQLGPNNSDYSVEQAVAHAYSQKATTFISTFIKDLNGNVSKGRQSGISKLMDQSLGNAKKASVFANGRVALQQPTAIVRAFAEISPKYLVGVKPTRENMKEMFEHCPIALWKSWGYYDINMGKSIEDLMMNNGSWIEDMASDLYGKLDNATWSVIWGMCKNEIKDTHKEVEEGTDEFFDLVNERMTEVVDLTQVVDSPFHRSHAMRSKDFLHKMTTAFMAEPTLTFNMVRDGFVRAREAWKEGNKAEARKIFSKTARVFLLQATTVAAAAAIWDAVRGKQPNGGDDDDKNKLQLWYANFLANLKDNLNLLNNIYYIKDIVSIMEGWDQKNLGLQGFKHIADAKNQLFGTKRVFSNNTWYENALYGIGYLTGIPFKTLMNDSKSIMNMFGVHPGFLDYADEHLMSLQDMLGGESAAAGISKPSAKASDDVAVDPKIRSDEEEFTVGSLASKFLGIFGIGADANTESEEADTELEDLPEGLTEEQIAEIRKTEKRRNKGKTEGEDGEAVDETDRDEQTMLFDATKAAVGYEGEERDKKIWASVSKGYKDHIDNGDFRYIYRMRHIVEELGGDTDYLDEQVMKYAKSAMKKTIISDPTDEQIEQQTHIKNYLLGHGMTEDELSEIAYESATTKDLKVAFRVNDEEAIVDELVTLLRAGISKDDIYRIYNNRNRIDLSKYDGKYKDKLKSTGKFVWPTQGTITSHFGYRNSPTAGASSNHPAIDIGAATGTPVVAADGGVVITAGSNGGYGNSVGIKHDNGMVTYYNHLYSWNVKVGDTVAQGQQIAQVGSTGISTGPHLDFKILDQNGKPVDPEKYLPTN